MTLDRTIGGCQGVAAAGDAIAGRVVEVCRVYVPARIGYCVLVDRLWPRGISRAEADVDEWLPGVAPSTELRRWYGHHVERFDEFSDRYRAELRRPPVDAFVDRLAAINEALTLVTATRDVEHSAAHVLRDVLRAELAAPERPESH